MVVIDDFGNTTSKSIAEANREIGEYADLYIDVDRVQITLLNGKIVQIERNYVGGLNIDVYDLFDN